MIFQGINVSGSMNVTGSFVVPKGTVNPATASSNQGDLFFNTVTDKLIVFTTSGSWKPVGDVSSSAPPVTEYDVDYIVVAGGGASNHFNGGGAGAGGRGILAGGTPLLASANLNSSAKSILPELS